MYTISSQKVISAIMSNCRTFRALLDFGAFSVSGADVGRITIEHSMSGDDTLSIGECIAKRAEIHLYGNRSVRKGDVFKLWLYLLDFDGVSNAKATHRSLAQWTHRELSRFTHAQIAALGRTKDPDGVPLDNYFIPFGEFVVTKVTLSGTDTEICAYDRLAFSEQIYAPSIAFPADAGEVIGDVLRQLGVTKREIVSGGELMTKDAGELLTANAAELLCSGEFTFTISDAPIGKTCREMLGAIAAMYGGNAILDRHGAYTTAFINTAGAGFDMEKLDEPDLSAEDIGISGIRCFLDDGSVLTAGSQDGTHIAEFSCPYMTQERIMEIWQALRHIRWRPSEFHERLADPRWDIGDLRYYTTQNQKLNIPIMSLTFHFDGGLSADITACGRSEDDMLI